MSLFGILILFLLGYFIVWPLIRILLRVNDARRQYRDMMNGMFGGADPRASRREDKRRSEARRKKKIPDDTGEYVAFEEVACNTGKKSPQEPAADFVAEQQIVDVEWEDIK